MNFKTIVNLCEHQGFLCRANMLRPPDLLDKAFLLGPVGALLLENLKNEWLLSMINHKEWPIFWSVNGFQDSYTFVRKICSERVPFGVAEVVQLKKPASDNNKFKDIKQEETKEAGVNQKSSEKVFDFSYYLNSSNHLRCTVFMPPSESLHCFHQWQRQRRRWWRKFSPTTGRYFTTEMQTNSNGIQTTEICAKYPWGDQTVETLTLSSNKHPILSETIQNNTHSGKRQQSHYLTSVIPESTLYLNSICDAYEVVPFQKETRTYLRLHRKLAPYKLSFSIPTSLPASVNAELSELALHICAKIRLNNISCLLIPSSTRESLEMQFLQYDTLGVPYTIVLNENTLKTGILYLRSRDTTLKEELHVTELVQYVDLLFKNY